LSAIVGQQISVKAAAAIRGRLWALMDQAPTAKALSELTWQELRDAGLSGRKIEYAQGLSTAVLAGDLPLESMDDLSDAAAETAITELKGFGPWSARIYLLFSEGRPDIYPVADLALEKGLQILLDLPEKPTPRAAEKLVEKYSPHRGALSFLLWALYGSASLD
jgi:DNA-3-methyladenine glycosylase II